MKKIIKKFINYIIDIDRIKNLLRPSNEFYTGLFNLYGHPKSREQQVPIDAEGNYLPWFTYPAIEYLKQLDLTKKSVLEWGCGYSSIFFEKRTKLVCSIEHNPDWFLKIKNLSLIKHKIILSDEKHYAITADIFGCCFDIIVIDGINRAECAELAPNFLNEGGLIILDNSDRDPEICEKLRDKNFIEVDMHGFGPINNYTWTTSLFFSKSFNFLPIDKQPVIPIGGGY